MTNNTTQIITDFKDVCKFDLKEFISNNSDLVKKFLKKKTLKLAIDDWNVDDIPERYFYQCKEGLLKAKIKGIDQHFTVLQKLEWIKCAVDIEYFVEKYVKIISIDEGIIPFKLWDYQRDLLNLYNDNRFVLTMQGRQTGKTQVTSAFITHFTLFKFAKTVAVLAQRADQAQEILERIQMSYELLPMFLQAGVKTYNKRSMKLGNDSRVFTASSSSSALRGKSIALLYVDEAAFLSNDMQFYESTYPTISSGTQSKIIMSSTPNGTRGMFYKLWQESIAGLNSYVRLMADWKVVPWRDEEWKRTTIANTSAEQFRQEHECVSGDTIINIKDEFGEYSMAIEDLYDLIENLKESDIKLTSIKEKAKERVGVVYKLIRSDFKEYVGTAINFKNRLRQHNSSDRFSEHKLLDYEILYEGNYYDCLLLEEYFINLYDTFNNGLNDSIDGKGNHLSPNFTTLGIKFSEERIQKLKDWHKSRDKSSYKKDYVCSEETKRKLSAIRMGKCYIQKLDENDVNYILKEYYTYKLNLEDCIKLDLIKRTQKERLVVDGWDGVEPLINKGGSVIKAIHPFSYIMADHYGVTANCIKAILRNKRKCYKS